MTRQIRHEKLKSEELCIQMRDTFLKQSITAIIRTGEELNFNYCKYSINNILADNLTYENNPKLNL